MSRQPGWIVWGIQSRAGYPSKRAGSRCRYVLPAAINVKMRGTGLRAAPGSWKPDRKAGRSGRARTCDPRFWRPVLYQLSYTPAGDLRRRRSAPFQAYGKAEWQGRKRLFERGVHQAAQHGPEVFALARTLRHEHGE